MPAEGARPGTAWRPALARRLRAGVLVAATAAIVLVVASAVRASGGEWAASGTARMTPDLVAQKPHGVRVGAKGSFSVSFWRFRAGWHSARFRLTTSRLTGSVLTAHIHTGAPGRNGPVLLSLCDRGRCGLTGAVMTVPSGTVEGWIETMELLGAYVDVHTKRNPRGELRGQIELRRSGS